MTREEFAPTHFTHTDEGEVILCQIAYSEQHQERSMFFSVVDPTRPEDNTKRKTRIQESQIRINSDNQAYFRHKHRKYFLSWLKPMKSYKKKTPKERLRV